MSFSVRPDAPLTIERYVIDFANPLLAFSVFAADHPDDLFYEVIGSGDVFSVPRFLTLYTAAESYWRSTKTNKTAWRPRKLAERANVDTRLTGATDEALAVMGAARNYHAHLSASGPFSPERIVDETFESTRRLHALLQACLMREIGFETDEIERLLEQYYRTWPID
jgi:hypothetical protein